MLLKFTVVLFITVSLEDIYGAQTARQSVTREDKRVKRYHNRGNSGYSGYSSYSHDYTIPYHSNYKVVSPSPIRSEYDSGYSEPHFNHGFENFNPNYYNSPSSSNSHHNFGYPDHSHEWYPDYHQPYFQGSYGWGEHHGQKFGSNTQGELNGNTDNGFQQSHPPFFQDVRDNTHKQGEEYTKSDSNNPNPSNENSQVLGPLKDGTFKVNELNNAVDFNNAEDQDIIKNIFDFTQFNKGNSEESDKEEFTNPENEFDQINKEFHSTQLNAGNQENLNDSNISSSDRITNSGLVSNESQNNSATSIINPNCLKFVPPPTPDFRGTGRRISQIKCYEYVWQLQLRSIQKMRVDDCQSKIFKISVVGGRVAKPGEFPHMAAIGWRASTGTWIFKCGGTLISPRYVLTAAHCSQASPRDTTIADPIPKIVRLGDTNIVDTNDENSTPIDVNIARFINHPQYSSPRQYFDIALIELQNDVTFTRYVQPACLWTNPNPIRARTKAVVTGWGVLEAAGRTSSPELQAGEVNIVDSGMCNQLLSSRGCNRNFCGLQNHQICAGNLTGGVDACQGDSGGPLQVQIPLPTDEQGKMHYVVGVISFGIGCALPDLPGVYSSVTSFADWVEGIVWP